MVGVALTLEDEHYLPKVWRNTKDRDCEAAHILWKKGSWQSMTFWEQNQIRATVWITEVIFLFFFFSANLHYWPRDDNRHIKCLIGLGREYVNVTGQIVRLNKRWSVRRVFLWGNITPERLTQTSCPLQAKWHNCFVSKNSALLLHIKAKVNRQPLNKAGLKPATSTRRLCHWLGLLQFLFMWNPFGGQQ